MSRRTRAAQGSPEQVDQVLRAAVAAGRFSPERAPVYRGQLQADFAAASAAIDRLTGNAVLGREWAAQMARDGLPGGMAAAGTSGSLERARRSFQAPAAGSMALGAGPESASDPRLNRVLGGLGGQASRAAQDRSPRRLGA